MSRLTQRLLEIKNQGKKSLIPFITGGDPILSITPALMHALVAGGADAIELNIAIGHSALLFLTSLITLEHSLMRVQAL